MTHLMIAIVAYLLLLALVIVFNHGAHSRFSHFKAIPFRDGLFYCPKER